MHNWLARLSKGTSMRAATLWRSHPKSGAAVLIFGTLWIVLVAWLYIWGEAANDWQLWFELFNGATWPERWGELQTVSPLWFAISLATRSVVNIAGPMGVIIGAMWLVCGGMENLMKMSLVELLRMHNVELVSNLSLMLKLRHPNTFTADDEDAMQDEAKRFLSEWQGELPKDADSNQQ